MLDYSLLMKSSFHGITNPVACCTGHSKVIVFYLSLILLINVKVTHGVDMSDLLRKLEVMTKYLSL